jgi:hypothetical protein
MMRPDHRGRAGLGGKAGSVATRSSSRPLTLGSRGGAAVRRLARRNTVCARRRQHGPAGHPSLTWR